MSHYVADDSDSGAHRYVRALCGVLVQWASHAVEPTCARCQQRLSAIAADDATLFHRLGYVEIAPGVMGPPAQKRGTA